MAVTCLFHLDHHIITSSHRHIIAIYFTISTHVAMALSGACLMRVLLGLTVLSLLVAQTLQLSYRTCNPTQPNPTQQRNANCRMPTTSSGCCIA
jgi:hypothetical protein